MLAVSPRRAQTHRPIWAVLLLAAGFAGLAAHAQEPAKPADPPAKPAAPPTEEEEAGPKKPTKPIPLDEPPPQKEKEKGKEPTPGGTPPEQEEGGDKGVYVAKLDDVARAAAAATQPAVKQYLSGFGFAYDLFNDSRFKSQRITPVPLLWGKDRFPDEFGVAPLDADNNVGEVKSVRRQARPGHPAVRADRAGEDRRVPQARRPRPAARSRPTSSPPPSGCLTAVMFFHDSARDQNRRRGKNWDEVKTEVYDRLTAVRVDRVKQAAADKDFARLKEFSGRLIALYKGNPKVLEPVYAARLAEAEELVKSDKVTDLEKGAELLNEYESRYPNTGNEAAKRVRAALAGRAATFLKEAERLMGTDKTQARNLLQTVRAINPDDPTLRQMQKELRTGYAVLVVGARRLPELMSPALARFDSEHQASELMFEGLLESIPDELTGVRFRPSLAAEWPGVGAGVRDVQLVRNAEWTGPGGGVFDATSVADTLRLLRQKPGSWAADSVSWLDEPGFDPSDPGRVKVRFKIGHPDPRQLLTLKLQPARWLLEQNKQIDDAGVRPDAVRDRAVQAAPELPPAEARRAAAGGGVRLQPGVRPTAGADGPAGDPGDPLRRRDAVPGPGS